MKICKKICCMVLSLVITLICTIPVYSENVAQRTVKVGFFSADGYHEINDSGIMGGYGYDFLQMLLRYNDWSYEYVGYDKNWGDMLGLLDSGEIDMVTLANKTPERELLFDYSEEAIGTSSTVMTVSSANTSIIPGKYDTYNGAVVGLVKGSSHNEKFEKYAAEMGFSYTTVFYDDIADLLSDLRAGNNVDIAVTSNMRVAHNEVILDEFNRTEYFAIVKKGNEELLSELNNGIEQMDVYSPDWRSDLFRKYYSNINDEVISFSPTEREYIAELKSTGTVIKAVMNPELQPYSYFEDGKPCGIVPKIFDEIAKRLGIEYEILYSADRTEYKSQLKSGEADIDLTAFQNFGIAQMYNLKETDPYLTTCLAMVTRSDSKLNSDDFTVAMVNDPTEYAAYNSDLTALHEYKQYKSLNECVDAVKKGECGAAFFYAYSAEQIVSDDYTHQLQYTIMPEYDFGLTIGVQNECNHNLLSVLNKGVSSISNSYIQSITLEEITNQSQSNSIESFIYNNPVLLAGISVAVVSVIAAIILLIVVYVNQKRTALTNIKLNRFIGYICESYDLVTEMNLKDRIRTDYHVVDGKLVEESYPYVPLVREDYEKIAHPEDVDKILATSDEERIGKMIDSGEKQNLFEVQIKDATGQYRWYSYLIRAVTKDSKHPRNYIMFKRDIQAEKEATAQQQQNLRDALESARSASAAKGQFLSRMSHEIRTPLNAVIGYMQIAKDCENDSGKIMHCIENTDSAAKHLLSIINDVLDISAIESGKLKVAHEDFNLKDLITDISTMFYNQSKARGVNFEVLLNGITHEWVVGDRLRVNQVLINLLSNAMKFTSENGNVTLKIEQQREEDNKIFLQFAISDTGIGMSAEFMSRLFKPFEQETAATVQKYGGTGLGLSIAYNLVEMMGGSISVHSVQNEGSTFTVTLHFGISSRDEEPTAPIDFSHIRVLVVDDEKDECTYIKTTLKHCGVKSDTVNSGELALKRIKSRAATDYAYDMCILDWKMPDMNGIDVAMKIREEFGKDMPIIIATAYDAMALEDEAKKAGANQVVSKPLFQSTIYNLLINTFGAKSLKEAVKDKSQVSLKGVNLLLAEDNAMNMEIAVTILEKAGATVTQATDGGQVCDMFLSSPDGTFDLILMDIQMPVLNGYEATRKIRQSHHAEAATIPIIAMTANAFAEDVAEALSNGMNAHIAKPVNYEKLYEIMNKFHIGGKKDDQ